jgi:hypothetical protein
MASVVRPSGGDIRLCKKNYEEGDPGNSIKTYSSADIPLGTSEEDMRPFPDLSVI